jgi:hypothetical protein
VTRWVAEVGLHKLVETLEPINDKGAVTAHSQVGEKARTDSLYADEIVGEQMIEELDAFQLDDYFMIVQVPGQQVQSGRRYVNNVQHAHVIYLAIVTAIRVHLHEGIVERLHHLFDDTVLAQILGIQLVRAQIAYQAQSGLDYRPLAWRLYGEQVSR